MANRYTAFVYLSVYPERNKHYLRQLGMVALVQFGLISRATGLELLDKEVVRPPYLIEPVKKRFAMSDEELHAAIHQDGTYLA